MTKCRHLTTTDAWESDGSADGWKPMPCFLCAWTAPALATAPAWVERRIGGGAPVNPKVDCAACPAFERQKPA